MRNVHALLAVISLLGLFACSDDTVKRDGPASVDRAVSDRAAGDQGARDSITPREAQKRSERGASEAGGKLDGGATTTCGNKTCNASLQICVEKAPVGPAISYECVAVPNGCENNRTCACVKSTICVGAYNVCTDVNTPNTVHCECPNCQ